MSFLLPIIAVISTITLFVSAIGMITCKPRTFEALNKRSYLMLISSLTMFFSGIGILIQGAIL